MGHRPMSTLAAFRSRCHGSPGKNRAGFCFPKRRCNRCRVVASTVASAQVREAQRSNPAGRKSPPDKHGCCAKLSCRHVLPWLTLRAPCVSSPHSHANTHLRLGSIASGRSKQRKQNMLIGYARVSTVEQHTALQLDALRNAGCVEIYQEKQSAVKKRPELERCLASLRAGDVLIVYKLDRLARSLKHLLMVLERLEAVGAGLRSITEPVDTSTPMGKLIIQVLGAVAEFERTLIRERSIAGQVAAIKRGVKVGSRPKKLSDTQVEEIKRLYATGEHTLASIGALYSCSHTTIRRAIYGDERDRMLVLRQYL